MIIEPYSLLCVEREFLVIVNLCAEFLIFLLPCFLPGPAVNRLELRNQFRAFLEIRDIFRHVPAGFGDKIPECLEYLRPHDIRPVVIGVWCAVNFRGFKPFSQSADKRPALAISAPKTRPCG